MIPQKVQLVIFSVFGDESADETNQRVFAVSGIVGNAAEWKAAEAAWVERTKGIEFHATECEYEGNFELYKDLAQILAKSYIAGCSVSLDLIAFREILPTALPDVGYYQCLSKVLTAHATMAREWNQRVESNPDCGDPLIELEFTFDHRIQSEGNAGTLYSAFVNMPEWKENLLLDSKISFESRKNPRIQMADMIAREAMKDLDRKIGPEQFPERKSKIALAGDGHFKFIELGREHILLIKQLAEEQKAAHGYLEWLQKTKRVQNGRPHDNWGNRFAYFAWLDSRDALGPRS